MKKIMKAYLSVAVLGSVLLLISCGDNSPEPGFFLLGEYDAPGEITAIDVSDDGAYAYIAIEGYGMQVVDISQPDSSRLIGDVGIFAYAYDLDAFGNFVCIADGSDGLQIVDVSTPNQPGQAGALDLSGTAWSLETNGQQAYIVNGLGVVQIADISDPTAPTLIGSIDIQGENARIAIADSLLIIADLINSLLVYDISDPANPDSLGSNGWIETPTDIEAAFPKCYLGGGFSIETFDLSDPANPLFIASQLIGNGGQLLAKDNYYLFSAGASDSVSGIRSYDLRDIAVQQAVDSYSLKGIRGAMYARDGQLYLSTDNRLLIFEYIPSNHVPNSRPTEWPGI